MRVKVAIQNIFGVTAANRSQNNSPNYSKNTTNT